MPTTFQLPIIVSTIFEYFNKLLLQDSWICHVIDKTKSFIDISNICFLND